MTRCLQVQWLIASAPKELPLGAQFSPVSGREDNFCVFGLR
jgi:hypothetical protein